MGIGLAAAQTEPAHQQALVPFEDPPPRKKREAARTRVDLAWVLPDDLRDYCRSRGWPDQRIDFQFDKFKNFHHAKGNLMASWPSAWRTWVGNDYDGKGGKPGGSTPNRADSAIDGMFSDLKPEDFHLGRSR